VIDRSWVSLSCYDCPQVLHAGDVEYLVCVGSDWDSRVKQI